jgi:hypothetical protein
MIRKLIWSTAIAAGILNFVALPGFSQWANREVCSWLGYTHQSGYCVNPNEPQVMTLTIEGSHIYVGKLADVDRYNIMIYGPRNDEPIAPIILWMTLLGDRTVEDFLKGSPAIAENYRTQITSMLDMVDDWEPLATDGF